MRLLSAVQKLHRFDEVLDAQEMMYLEWFVLDCMPIAEMMEGKAVSADDSPVQGLQETRNRGLSNF